MNKASTEFRIKIFLLVYLSSYAIQIFLPLETVNITVLRPVRYRFILSNAHYCHKQTYNVYHSLCHHQYFLETLLPTDFPISCAVIADSYMGSNRVDGQGYCVQRHFQQYFSYIVAVSFIDGGKRGYTEKTTDLSQVTEKHTVATDYKNTMYMLLHSDTLS